jgi:hypothetical protein
MKKHELITFYYKGYYCVIRENGMGYLCGYVFLPENHEHIKDEHESKWNVHGGITFTEPKLDDRVPTSEFGLWIGFDCAHYGDRQSPEYLIKYPDPVIYTGNSTYKDESYVEIEIQRLVEQLGIHPNKLIDKPQDFILDLPL